MSIVFQPAGKTEVVSVPPIIPTHIYKCVMVLLNEAATIDTLHMRPPVITTGLLP